MYGFSMRFSVLLSMKRRLCGVQNPKTQQSHKYFCPSPGSLHDDVPIVAGLHVLRLISGLMAAHGPAVSRSAAKVVTMLFKTSNAFSEDC